MIPTQSEAAFEAGWGQLRAFGAQSGARGRLIALYLGLRLMREGIAPLGSDRATSTGEIQRFLDRMWTKTHRLDSRVVLTAPFGGGGGAGGGFSAPTGIVAAGSASASNIWRNNMNSQKGVGCVAPPSEIEELVTHEDPRAACPHFATDAEGHICMLSGARYRGEKQAIWLGRGLGSEGFQVVDLDQPSAFDGYLRPSGMRIPVFALMATLYCLAPSDVYPPRNAVSLQEFRSDFGFSPEFVDATFDCDPLSPANAAVLGTAGSPTPSSPTVLEVAAGPNEALPPIPSIVALNSGVPGELAVATALSDRGWVTYYTGNQPLLGYDLRCELGNAQIHVEVKSSVGYTIPVLTESEWAAALELKSSYYLAIVDFVGSANQTIRFIQNPGETVVPTLKSTVAYRLPPTSWSTLAAPEPPSPGS